LNMVKGVRAAASWLASWLNAYNSAVLGREIDTRQSLLLLNACCAFVACAFAACPVLPKLACCVWLLHALRLCKQAL